MDNTSLKSLFESNSGSEECDIIFGKNYTDVAIDNGYADHKIAFWARDKNGKAFIATIQLPSRAQMGRVNVSVTGKSAGLYEVDGDFWTVSKDVRDPESIRGKSYATSELNAVLVNNSLIAAGFSGHKVRIATGLPFDHIYVNGERDEMQIKKVKNSLEIKVNPVGEHKSTEIVAHEVYPESTAAYVHYALDHMKGTMIKEIRSGLAVVDIGGNTTDITYINSDNTNNIEMSGSRQIGVLNVRDRLKILICKDFSIEDINDRALDNAIRTGLCELFGEEVDVSEQLIAAKKQTSKKVMNFVEEKVGDAADLDAILYVGGGAKVLEDVLKTYQHAHVSENPQFANAIGMLLFMTYADKQPDSFKPEA